MSETYGQTRFVKRLYIHVFIGACRHDSSHFTCQNINVHIFWTFRKFYGRIIDAVGRATVCVTVLFIVHGFHNRGHDAIQFGGSGRGLAVCRDRVVATGIEKRRVFGRLWRRSETRNGEKTEFASLTGDVRRRRNTYLLPLSFWANALCIWDTMDRSARIATAPVACNVYVVERVQW